jgi:hypothetical protein
MGIGCRATWLADADAEADAVEGLGLPPGLQAARTIAATPTRAIPKLPLRGLRLRFTINSSIAGYAPGQQQQPAWPRALSFDMSA